MGLGVEAARVRFGPYELDRQSGELTKFGHKLRLQEQPFQILVLLLDRPGEVVTREQLQQKLWASDTFVDFEHGLNNAIKRLREALLDSADKPRYIETLPRRGYRFIASVEVEAAAAAPAVSVAPEAEAAAKPRRPGLAIAAAGALTALVITGFAVRSTWAPKPVIHSVAVLPLANLSGDPGQQYVADGITDAITTELAQVSSLRVVSRTSAMRYRDGSKPVAQIAHELNVDAVIEGSVARQGEHIRVMAELIYAPTDAHFWAGKYDRRIGDALNLQSELAADIAHQVEANLTPDEQSRLARSRSVDPAAYDLYLQARFYSQTLNRESNERAIALLEKAVAADPTFALAYSALAYEYRTRALETYRDDDQFNQKAFFAAEKAIQLDPGLAEGYVSRATVLWSSHNDFPHESAVAELKHALALNPNSDEAHHQLANIYNHIGLLEKAQAEIEKAAALNPSNPGTRFRVAINLIYQGKNEDALARISHSRDFFPSLWAYQTGFALMQLGRRDEVKELMRQSEKIDRTQGAALLRSMEAMVAASEGDTSLAEKKIREAIEMGTGFQHFHHTEYGVASAYALMNRHDEALRWLKRAAEDGFPCYPLYARDRNLDNLRQDPAFLAFISGLEKQWQHYQATL